MSPEASLGTTCLADGRRRFRVWVPLAQEMELHIVPPRERFLPSDGEGRGYHHDSEIPAWPA